MCNNKEKNIIVMQKYKCEKCGVLFEENLEECPKCSISFLNVESKKNLKRSLSSKIIISFIFLFSECYYGNCTQDE